MWFLTLWLDFLHLTCCDCHATYISEAGRNLNTRLTEHRRATRNGDNNIAEHHLQINQRIDWDSATCVTFSTNYYQRIILESWFTNLKQTPINRCLQLPTPYKWLIDDINRQRTHWFTLTVPPNVLYNTHTDLRPTDRQKHTYHCLVFPANHVMAQLTVDQ